MPDEDMLAIKADIRGGIGFIDLRGRLQSESRYDLERRLRTWIEGEATRHVIVSCAELVYIDSAGLAALIGALHRLRRKGGDLLLAEINGELESLFELSSMNRYFSIYAHVEDARAELVARGVKAKPKPKPKPKKAKKKPGKKTAAKPPKKKKAQAKKKKAAKGKAVKKKASPKKKGPAKKSGKKAPAKKKRKAAKKKAVKKKAAKKKAAKKTKKKTARRRTRAKR